MDAMSLSLDEIIKKKKVGKPQKPAGGVLRGVKKGGGSSPMKRKSASLLPAKRGPVGKLVDARQKIIQRNRSQIRDARDKLVEKARSGGDARLRIIKKKGGNIGKLRGKNGSLSLKTKKKTIALHDIDYGMEIDDYPPIAPLRRTVTNEIAFNAPSSMPPLPTFGRQIRHSPPPSSWSSDPFDCYEVPVRRPIEKEPPQMIQREFRNDLNIMDNVPRRGILRARRPSSPVSRYDDRAPLSSSLRARLHSGSTPDRHESMGIFAKMPPNDPPPASPSPPPYNPGYRIVVSNLHGSVTQNDIKELFEDIGDLLESRLVRSGVAEVIFRNLKDAEEAVDTYHNRQLDGQPMKCLLVKPKSAAPLLPPKYSSSFSRQIKNSSSSAKAHLEIDMDVLHKALFKR